MYTESRSGTFLVWNLSVLATLPNMCGIGGAGCMDHTDGKDGWSWDDVDV